VNRRRRMDGDRPNGPSVASCELLLVASDERLTPQPNRCGNHRLILLGNLPYGGDVADHRSGGSHVQATDEGGEMLLLC
jgi:hypothetical protein